MTHSGLDPHKYDPLKASPTQIWPAQGFTYTNMTRSGLDPHKYDPLRALPAQIWPTQGLTHTDILCLGLGMDPPPNPKAWLRLKQKAETGMRALCEATAGTAWVRALWLLGQQPQSPFCQCAPMVALWQQWVVQLSLSLLRQTLLVLRKEVHIPHMGKWYLSAIRKIWNQMELRLNDWFLFNDNNK